MKVLLFSFALLTSINLFAQNDRKPTSVVIPKAMEREVNANKAPAVRQEETKTNSPFNPIEFKPITTNTPYKIEKPTQGYVIGQKQENKFNNEEKFQAPYQIQREIVINKSNEGDSNAFKRDQSFGDHRTKSETIKVRFKDYAAVDGDRVKISVNGLTIREDVYLTETFKTIEIGLTPGFNKLEFTALNQGSSGPNTAQFMIVDDKDHTIINNRWDLATGFKGTVLIIKE